MHFVSFLLFVFIPLLLFPSAPQLLLLPHTHTCRHVDIDTLKHIQNNHKSFGNMRNATQTARACIQSIYYTLFHVSHTNSDSYNNQKAEYGISSTAYIHIVLSDTTFSFILSFILTFSLTRRNLFFLSFVCLPHAKCENRMRINIHRNHGPVCIYSDFLFRSEFGMTRLVGRFPLRNGTLSIAVDCVYWSVCVICIHIFFLLTHFAK